MRVLLVGNNDRSALAACRALGESGVEVGIAPIGEWGVAHKSRYCKTLHEVEEPKIDVKRAAEGIIRAVRELAYEVVIPLSDAACLICQGIRDRIEAKVALPDTEVFAFAHDKSLLLERCKELKIPTPEEGNLEYPPVYLKPVHSAKIHQNRMLTFSVKGVQNRREGVDFLREFSGVVDVLVQEECPGEGAGVYLLADRGKVISMVQQNRLHEPSGGGGGSYRHTVPLDPELQEYTEKLIRSINWSGVAMVEFKGYPGHWRIMELNGRFWGSLALTTAAGCNYPLWLCEYLLGNEFSCEEPHLGVRQRHLGKDLRWALSKRDLLHWAGELLTHRDPLDVESLRDPLPAVSYWSKGFNRIEEWLHERVELSDYRRLENSIRGSTLNELNRDTHVLFVCRGNICRSPFAEAYIREKLGMENVRSCGTYEVPLRQVPEVAEKIAREEFSVDLSSHRSQAISESLLRWADVVFVMDRKQLVELAPRVKGRMMLLRANREIPDPYGGDEATYLACYQEIIEACEALFSRGTLSFST